MGIIFLKIKFDLKIYFKKFQLTCEQSVLNLLKLLKLLVTFTTSTFKYRFKMNKNRLPQNKSFKSEPFSAVSKLTADFSSLLIAKHNPDGPPQLQLRV